MDELLVNLLSAIACICVIFLGFTFEKLRRYSKSNAIKEWVAWCVTSDSHLYRSGLHLRDYVKNAQIDLQINQKYRIAGDEEWEYACEILSAYQNELSKDYFEGKLGYIKSKHEIPGHHYFMLTLAAFLEQHQGDYENCGQPMMDISRNSAKHISAFGIAYYKLYYIAGIFCQNSKLLAPNGIAFYQKTRIEEILMTGIL